MAVQTDIAILGGGLGGHVAALRAAQRRGSGLEAAGGGNGVSQLTKSGNSGIIFIYLQFLIPRCLFPVPPVAQ